MGFHTSACFGLPVQSKAEKYQVETLMTIDSDQKDSSRILIDPSCRSEELIVFRDWAVFGNSLYGGSVLPTSRSKGLPPSQLESNIHLA